MRNYFPNCFIGLTLRLSRLQCAYRQPYFRPLLAKRTSPLKRHDPAGSSFNGHTPPMQTHSSKPLATRYTLRRYNDMEGADDDPVFEFGRWEMGRRSFPSEDLSWQKKCANSAICKRKDRTTAVFFLSKINKTRSAGVFYYAASIVCFLHNPPAPCIHRIDDKRAKNFNTVILVQTCLQASRLPIHGEQFRFDLDTGPIGMLLCNRQRIGNRRANGKPHRKLPDLIQIGIHDSLQFLIVSVITAMPRCRISPDDQPKSEA